MNNNEILASLFQNLRTDELRIIALRISLRSFFHHPFHYDNNELTLYPSAGRYTVLFMELITAAWILTRNCEDNTIKTQAITYFQAAMDWALATRQETELEHLIDEANNSHSYGRVSVYQKMISHAERGASFISHLNIAIRTGEWEIKNFHDSWVEINDVQSDVRLLEKQIDLYQVPIFESRESYFERWVGAKKILISKGFLRWVEWYEERLFSLSIDDFREIESDVELNIVNFAQKRNSQELANKLDIFADTEFEPVVYNNKEVSEYTSIINCLSKHSSKLFNSNAKDTVPGRPSRLSELYEARAVDALHESIQRCLENLPPRDNYLGEFRARLHKAAEAIDQDNAIISYLALSMLRTKIRLAEEHISEAYPFAGSLAADVSALDKLLENLFFRRGAFGKISAHVRSHFADRVRKQVISHSEEVIEELRRSKLISPELLRLLHILDETSAEMREVDGFDETELVDLRYQIALVSIQQILEGATTYLKKRLMGVANSKVEFAIGSLAVYFVVENAGLLANWADSLIIKDQVLQAIEFITAAIKKVE